MNQIIATLPTKVDLKSVYRIEVYSVIIAISTVERFDFAKE
jgi:hypothetical protein